MYLCNEVHFCYYGVGKGGLEGLPGNLMITPADTFRTLHQGAVRRTPRRWRQTDLHIHSTNSPETMRTYFVPGLLLVPDL